MAATALKAKITNKNANTTQAANVKIRSAVYNELKTLWEEINKKYFLYYDKVEEDGYSRDAKRSDRPGQQNK